jgi:hypothetical protein
MYSLNPLRFLRALARSARSDDALVARRALPAARVVEPTIYADAPLSRVLIAIERRANDLEAALAEYVRARRAVGMLPEAVLVEFKRVLRRSFGADVARPQLTGRLIQLYFAA